MDNQNLIVSDDEIREMRKLLAEYKKQEEFSKLKDEIYDINFKANNTLHEFNGGMKQVDTNHILKSKKKIKH